MLSHRNLLVETKRPDCFYQKKQSGRTASQTKKPFSFWSSKAKGPHCLSSSITMASTPLKLKKPDRFIR
jgi:hypothetical protein